MLWATGIDLASGGLISGALAYGMFKLLGTIASVIVLSLVLVICLMGALRLTIGAVIGAIRSHERVEYDEEDYARRLKALQEEAAEAEKERIRAERRAANPDGITANTSKKKLQQQAQKDKEAAKAAAAREYAIRKGEYVEEEDDNTPKTLSGIPDRPFCKGRAYDPNRYSVNNTEE